MKRILVAILVVTMLVASLPGMTGCSRKSRLKDWYNVSLDVYREGLKTNWANEEEYKNLNIADDLKGNNPNKKIGYLLVNLDEDGVDELLVGFNDGSTATKFTDVLVWHSDFGAYKLLGGGSGYYIYLCAGNVLAVDSWYGSQTERTYMTWNSKTNSFPLVDGEGKYLPMKWDLTEF